ncbi:MAG: hypothetical protein ACOH17_00875 [Cellulomonas sp.]
MNLVDALGWAGSALLVYSVLQSRMLRFRILNFAASLALVAFNAMIAVWPMVAMNAALCVIDAWFAVSLIRQRRRGRAFEWVGAASDDPFVSHFLTHHGEDVAEFFPAARDLPAALRGVSTSDTLCALILHGDVTVGLVVATTDTSTTGATWRLLVDYVIPGYRDYTAGSFIYSPAGPFAARGARGVLAAPELAPVHTYLGSAGFEPADEGWELTLKS